jgi:hypothetical protein
MKEDVKVKASVEVIRLGIIWEILSAINSNLSNLERHKKTFIKV